MYKLFITVLFLISFNANAFLDFNSYGVDYKNNDWPIWTPMYWMEKVTDNDIFGNQRNRGYSYPYNNRPYNIGASQFDMSQMPTPGQAYQAESNYMPQPMYTTPAAQSFTNRGIMPPMGGYDLPSPYPSDYQSNQLPSPYPSNYQPNQLPSPYPIGF
jgi:hypothetical protein